MYNVLLIFVFINFIVSLFYQMFYFSGKNGNVQFKKNIYCGNSNLGTIEVLLLQETYKPSFSEPNY
jgi:hypothetical protein